MEWSPEEDPVESHYSVTVMVPARVKAERSLVTVMEGGEAELSCSATGSPAPAVRWTGPSGVQRAANTSVLSLQRVTRTEAGLFTCTAENGAGYQAEDSVTLEVQCKSKRKYNSISEFPETIDWLDYHL